LLFLLSLCLCGLLTGLSVSGRGLGAGLLLPYRLLMRRLLPYPVEASGLLPSCFLSFGFCSLPRGFAAIRLFTSDLALLFQVKPVAFSLLALLLISLLLTLLLISLLLTLLLVSLLLRRRCRCGLLLRNNAADYPRAETKAKTDPDTISGISRGWRGENPCRDHNDAETGTNFTPKHGYVLLWATLRGIKLFSQRTGHVAGFLYSGIPVVR